LSSHFYYSLMVAYLAKTFTTSPERRKKFYYCIQNIPPFLIDSAQLLLHTFAIICLFKSVLMLAYLIICPHVRQASSVYLFTRLQQKTVQCPLPWGCRYKFGRFSLILYAMKALWVSRGIAVLFLGLDGGGGSAPRPGRLYPRERPGTHFTGGWVGPRAGLDGRKISIPSDSIQDRPARSQSLYWLSYPAHVDTNLIPAISPLYLSHKLLCFKFNENFICFKRVSRSSCGA